VWGRERLIARLAQPVPLEVQPATAPALVAGLLCLVAFVVVAFFAVFPVILGGMAAVGPFRNGLEKRIKRGAGGPIHFAALAPAVVFFHFTGNVQVGHAPAQTALFAPAVPGSNKHLI